MSQVKIANSIKDVSAGSGAVDVGDLVQHLKDIDVQRISKNDDVVIRKGFLGLLAVVGRLEERIVELEQSRETRA